MLRVHSLGCHPDRTVLQLKVFYVLFLFSDSIFVTLCVCVCVLSQEKIKIKNPWRVSSKKLLVMSKKSDVIIFNQTSLYSMHCFLK